jgi:hypothetical protein
VTTKTAVGSALLFVSALVLIGNLGDLIRDLNNWHVATTPQIVGAMLKQISSVGLAAVGGTLIPTPGGPA